MTTRLAGVLLLALASCAHGPAAPGPALAAAAAPLAPLPSRDWRDEVVYFALVDRFADGDPSNDAAVDRSAKGAFHGGDLKGLLARLDEIASLGATALWVNPLVKNIDGFVTGAGFPDWAYHGYWADDFGRLDPRFGDEADLRALVEAAFALNEHPRVVGPRRYRYHSPIVSAEWCALTNVPWGRGLVNFAPEEEALALETYRTWARLFELLRYYSWMVDRFHLFTRVHQLQARGVDYDFRWLEERLLPLGFRLVLCTRRPETFGPARAERLRVSGKPSQYDDLDAFVREQDLFRRLAGASLLPRLELDVSDGDVPAAADRIADWLERTGGLHSP